MANYYRIAYAQSQAGEDLHIPILWEFDSVADLSVALVDSNGKASICDYWYWNSSLNQVEISNTQNYTYWAAFVSRREDATVVLQEIESKEVNARNIIEQFRKTNRIIEVLQEDIRTSLRSTDRINGLLPNAESRANKFLSFDDDGNPECVKNRDAFDEAIRVTSANAQASEEAKIMALQAQSDAISARNKTEEIKLDTEGLVNGFDENVEEKTGLFNSNAEEKIEQVEQSERNALASALNASNSASLAGISANNAKLSEDKSGESERKAKLSETESAENARISQEVNASTQALIEEFVSARMPINALRLRLMDDNGAFLTQDAILRARIKSGVPTLNIEIASDIQENGVFESLIFDTDNPNQRAILTVKLRNGVCVPSWNLE